MQNYKKIYKVNTGYTIIETMISVSLFLVVVMSGMGALLNASLLSQKSQSMRSIMDSMNFVMEDMSRNIRTGYNYRCLEGADNITTPAVTHSCPRGWGIAFESDNGLTTNNNDQWVYYIDNTGKLFKSTSGPYSASSFIQITPDEIVIDTNNSYFVVTGAEGVAVDSIQPLVTLRLVGTITFKNVVTPFSLQTSVSQRLIDI